MGLSSFSMGFTVGFGSGLLSREIFPILGEIVKPITRVSIKTAIKLFERSREMLVRSGETLEDLIAEVQVELKQARKQKQKVSPKPTKRPQPPSPPIDITEVRKAA